MWHGSPRPACARPKPTIKAYWTPAFTPLDLPGGIRPRFLLKDKRAHSRASGESAGARSPRLMGCLVAKVSDLSLKPKWVEGHPTTRLLEEGVESRSFFLTLSKGSQTLLFLPVQNQAKVIYDTGNRSGRWGTRRRHGEGSGVS